MQQSPPIPTSRACRDLAKRCAFVKEDGSRCGSPRLLRPRDQHCFWHSQLPSVIQKRDRAIGKGKVLLRAVLKDEEVGKLEFTTPAELYDFRSWLARLVLTGKLDPRAAREASELAGEAARDFEATREAYSLQRIRPEDLQPEMLVKVEGRESKPGDHGAQYEKLVAQHLEVALHDRGIDPQSARASDRQDVQVQGALREAQALANKQLLMDALVDPTDPRPLTRKVEEAGMTLRQFLEWVRFGFLREVREAVVARVVAPHLPRIAQNLVRRALQDEEPAQRMIVQLVRGKGIERWEDLLCQESLRELLQEVAAAGAEQQGEVRQGERTREGMGHEVQ